MEHSVYDDEYREKKRRRRDTRRFVILNGSIILETLGLCSLEEKSRIIDPVVFNCFFEITYAFLEKTRFLFSIMINDTVQFSTRSRLTIPSSNNNQSKLFTNFDVYRISILLHSDEQPSKFSLFMRLRLNNFYYRLFHVRRV